MGKSEIVQQWKPGLRELGFVYKNGVFEHLATREKYLQFLIAIQRNSHSPNYKIGPTLVIRNPLLELVKPEVLLSANLRPDGIYLHGARTSWWLDDALPEAWASLEKHAIPWFEKMGRVGYLVEVLEKAIRDKTGPINILEPIDESAHPAWIKNWLPEKPLEARRVGPMFFYQSAVLHYLNGNRAKAIERTRDWSNSLGPENRNDRLRAAAQLDALKTASH